MATGGGSPEINDGQEESFDWNCNVCEETDLVTEASVFCQTCNKCLCKNCLRNHNTFTKRHTLLGQEDKKSWGIQSSSIRRRINIGCTKHAKEPVSFYCGHHDEVCCALCALESHSGNCKNDVKPISSVANSLALADEYNHVRDDIRRLVSTFSNTEKDILLGQSTLKSSRNKCKSNIDEFVDQVINRLKQLQRVSTDQFNQLYDNYSEDINQDLNICSETKQELFSIETQLDKYRGEFQEEEAFITMNLFKKKIPALEQKLSALSTYRKKRISFIANKDILQIVELHSSLGSTVIAADSLWKNPADKRLRNDIQTLTKSQGTRDIRNLEKTEESFVKQLELEAQDALEFKKKKKELRDAINRRHYEALETAIKHGKESRICDKLSEPIKEAETVRDHLKHLRRIAGDVLEMKQSTIAELRSLKIPRPIVKDVMQATFLMLGEKKRNIEEWEDLQILMGQQGKTGMLRRVRQFDTVNVTPETQQAVVELIADYDECDVRLANGGAVTFYKWLKNVNGVLSKEDEPGPRLN